MRPDAASSPDPDAETAAAARFIRVALLVAFTYVFLANAWLGDDAYISFRAAWNLVHGFGLTFNPAERVQAFTNPLWTLLVAAAHLLTRDFPLTVTVMSWAFDVAAGLILLRRARDWRIAGLLVAWLLSSKALVDYGSSGLEYPLAYCLIALFFTRYLGRPAASPPAGSRELAIQAFIAALAFVTRPDSIVLLALPLAEMAWRASRARGWKAMPALLAGFAPALVWLLFATFYYGFPLPNTYYAKVANGVPAFLRRAQGFAYLLNSIRFDPITVGTIALALLLGWRQRGPARWTAYSLALSVAYSVEAGGDFMSGRFFAPPFLVAVAVVVPSLAAPLARPVAAGLVLYNLLIPAAPVRTTPGQQAAWPWRTQNGIKDEMGISHADSNVLGYAPLRPLPDTPFAREGLSLSASDRRFAVYCCVGMYGLNAGPGRHVIDSNALADPLLARLPVSPRVYFDFWASHYFRDIPEGYPESVERDENLLADPLLHAYYERLRNVTRGSVWRWSRLRDILELNAGRSRHVGEMFERHRSVELSIAASHERFRTDIGERDGRAGTLSAEGRDGYLQLGPGIPLKAGAYRVRWKGRAQQVPAPSIGRVEVWAGDRLILRQAVTPPGAEPPPYLAQADFTLSRSVPTIEYRFWMNGLSPVTIERIELYSAVAVPPDR